MDNPFGLAKETGMPLSVLSGDKQISSEVLEVGKAMTNPGAPSRDIDDSSRSAASLFLQGTGSFSNPPMP